MKMTFCLSSCDLLTIFVKYNFINGIEAVNGAPLCSENMTIHFDPDLRYLDRISSGTNLINTGEQIPRFSITVLKFSKCRYVWNRGIFKGSLHTPTRVGLVIRNKAAYSYNNTILRDLLMLLYVYCNT
jgi:hypothetical protein